VGTGGRRARRGDVAVSGLAVSADGREVLRRPVIVSSMASDSHTWNLIFLQLLIEELGFDVVNLGACVPDEVIEAECLARNPAMLVLSSVNGHGYQDGLRVITRLRGRPELAGTPMIIGGKLGISADSRAANVEALLTAGFDAVHDDRPDGPDGPTVFRRFVAARITSGPA
jgi:methylaspartate mutase sigma subunit